MFLISEAPLYMEEDIRKGSDASSVAGPPACKPGGRARSGGEQGSEGVDAEHLPDKMIVQKFVCGVFSTGVSRP
jgi:hypothetical protein